MSAFDNHKKPNKMAQDVTELKTTQLLDLFDGETLTQSAWEALQELKARIINQGDSDATSKSTGGVRPRHAPIV